MVASNGRLLSNSRGRPKKRSPYLVVSSNRFANFLVGDDLIILSRAQTARDLAISA